MIETQQELLNYNPESPDWAAVKILLDEVDQEISARRSHLLYRVNAWLIARRIFRKTEDRKLLLAEPTMRDVEYHRAYLSLLIGHGDILLMELKRHQEIDTEHIGVSFAAIAACVEELRMDQRARYGDMTEARRSEILREVFGAE